MENLHFLQVFFILVAIGYTVVNVQDRFFTNKTTKSEIIRKVEDIRFPVLLSFLMLDNFDVEVLKSNGYTTVYDLFMGIKKDNYKMYRGKFNWEGDNSTIQEIILQSSKYSSNINEIIVRITLFHCNKERCRHTGFEDFNEWFTIFHYPTLKYTMELPVLSSDEKLLGIEIKIIPNILLEIVLEDKLSFIRRNLFENQKKQMGKKIFTPKKFLDNSSVYKEYFISFSQLVLSQEDENSNCVNYPTEVFANYSDCDGDFIKRSLPKNLSPFWAVQNISEATNKYDIKQQTGNSDRKAWAFMDQLFSGSIPPDCKIPCVQTTTTVLEGTMSRKTGGKENSFYFTIDQKVKTEIVSVDKFNFNDFLNFLGANMGLWPGMGVFQILEGALLVIAGHKIFAKIRNILTMSVHEMY